MPVLLISIQHEHLTSDRLELLDKFRGDMTMLITQDKEKMEQVIDDVEIAVGTVPPGLIEKAGKLKWFHQMGTGTEWLMRHPQARDQPFILTNCSDDYGVVLAEHVMSLMLAAARQLPEQFDSQSRGKWEQAPFSAANRFELRGKTLLLLGVGSIGLNIAKRAKAFDMTITGYRSDPSKCAENVDKMYGPDELHAAIAETDLIANSLPITDETRRLIDAAAIGQMKETAWFFNIGRGTTVDEDALIDALQHKRIAGAGLDVFEKEPLPESSPLWQLPNVIITPHDGGNHNQRYASWVSTCFDNLERYHTGKSLRNVVDKQAGY
ncbi:MAG: D-2-hydroxyacid dehydrogenase [Puniceicoccaceae bacterium]